MKQAFELASEQTEQLLHGIDWSSYGSILFISKKHWHSHIFCLCFQTQFKGKKYPVYSTGRNFFISTQGSIAFHGTADPWAETDSVQALAAQKKFLFSLPKMPTILWKPAMCRPIFPS
ncbi:MAG: hypothetical protein ACLTN0_03260 [Coprococcus phoceensis]